MKEHIFLIYITDNKIGMNLKNHLAGIMIVAFMLQSSCTKNKEDGTIAPPTPTPSFPTVQQLNAAEQYSIGKGGQSFLVMHDGKIVRETYSNGGGTDRVQLLASATKGFTGMIGAIADQEDIIDLDTPVVEVLTEWRNDAQKSRITYRHLLTMSSGLEELKDQKMWVDYLKAKVLYPAGSTYIYGPDPNLFGLALQRKLGAQKVEDYMNTRLFQPLGIRVEWRGRFEDGNPQLSGGAYVRANEWIKFGEYVRLMLEDRWAGPQILTKQMLLEVLKSSAAYPAYGFYWWLKEPVPDSVGRRVDALNSNQHTIQIKPILEEPLIPDDFVMCRGAYGQCLYVIPSRKLVVVRNAPASVTEMYKDHELLVLLLKP
jgi:CubicO group peptidase (beta-lactamase class C family)